jgi:Flp pilus assembly protein TadD
MSWPALAGPAALVGADRSVPGQYVSGRLHQRLRTARITTTGVGEVATGDNYWLGQARRALMMSDYHTAVYAAGIARQQYGESAQMWNVLARADVGLGRYADAVLEARRAVQLAPDEAEHHVVLGGVLEEMGNGDAALGCYRVAQELDPEADEPRTGRASVLLRAGDVDQAVRILEAAHDRDRSTVGDHLGLALLAAAERVPRIRDGDTFLVTGADEVRRMRALLSRAAAVAHDPDLRAGIARVRRYVDLCGHREWVPARVVSGAPGWALLVAAGVLVLVAGVWNEAGWVALALAVAAVLGVGWHGRVPRWKLNRWAQDQETAVSSRRQPGAI